MEALTLLCQAGASAPEAMAVSTGEYARTPLDATLDARDAGYAFRDIGAGVLDGLDGCAGVELDVSLASRRQHVRP